METRVTLNLIHPQPYNTFFSFSIIYPPLYPTILGNIEIKQNFFTQTKNNKEKIKSQFRPQPVLETKRIVHFSFDLGTAKICLIQNLILPFPLRPSNFDGQI